MEIKIIPQLRARQYFAKFDLFLQETMILTKEFYVVYPPGSKCHEANTCVIVNQYILEIVIDSLVKKVCRSPLGGKL